MKDGEEVKNELKQQMQQAIERSLLQGQANRSKFRPGNEKDDGCGVAQD